MSTDVLEIERSKFLALAPKDLTPFFTRSRFLADFDRSMIASGFKTRDRPINCEFDKSSSSSTSSVHLDAPFLADLPLEPEFGDLLSIRFVNASDSRFFCFNLELRDFSGILVRGSPGFFDFEFVDVASDSFEPFEPLDVLRDSGMKSAMLPDGGTSQSKDDDESFGAFFLLLFFVFLGEAVGFDFLPLVVVGSFSPRLVFRLVAALLDGGVRRRTGSDFLDDVIDCASLILFVLLGDRAALDAPERLPSRDLRFFVNTGCGGRRRLPDEVTDCASFLLAAFLAAIFLAFAASFRRLSSSSLLIASSSSELAE